MKKKILFTILSAMFMFVAGFSFVGCKQKAKDQAKNYYTTNEVKSVLNSACGIINGTEVVSYSVKNVADNTNKVTQLPISSFDSDYFSVAPLANRDIFTSVNGHVIAAKNDVSVNIFDALKNSLFLVKNMVEEDAVEIYNNTIIYQVRNATELSPQNFDVKLLVTAGESLIRIQIYVSSGDDLIESDHLVFIFNESLNVTSFIFASNTDYTGEIYSFYDVAADKTYVLDKENEHYLTYQGEVSEVLENFEESSGTNANASEVNLFIECWKSAVSS